MTDEVKTNDEPESDDDLALKEKFTRWLGEIAAESGPPPEPKSPPKPPSPNVNLDEWFDRKMTEREERAKAKDKENSLLSRLEQLENKLNSRKRKRGVYSPFGG